MINIIIQVININNFELFTFINFCEKRVINKTVKFKYVIIDNIQVNTNKDSGCCKKVPNSLFVIKV